jgi:hypothetical protein
LVAPNTNNTDVRLEHLTYEIIDADPDNYSKAKPD